MKKEFSQQQVIALLSQFQTTKDLQTLSPLIQGYMDLIHKCAHRIELSRGAIEYGDLVSAGRIGLMHAATKYDISSSTPFKSFAPEYVREAIRQFHTSSSQTVQRPEQCKFTHIFESINAYLVNEDGEEIDLELSPSDIEAISVYQPEVDEQEKYCDLYAAIESLEPIEQQVIRLSFGFECDELDKKEIALRLHTTVARVNAIRYRALEKLKHMNIHR